MTGGLLVLLSSLLICNTISSLGGTATNVVSNVASTAAIGETNSG